MTYAKQLLEFIDQSPTAFHAVESLKKTFLSKEYTQLHETEKWQLDWNKKYFVCRDDSACIAFHTPKLAITDFGIKIIGSHTDSPCLKIKNNPITHKEGYQLLNIEVYGGVVLNSWFDRDLQIAGRVIIENETKE